LDVDTGIVAAVEVKTIPGQGSSVISENNPVAFGLKPPSRQLLAYLGENLDLDSGVGVLCG
jgi:hypothetical protein